MYENGNERKVRELNGNGTGMEPKRYEKGNVNGIKMGTAYGTGKVKRTGIVIRMGTFIGTETVIITGTVLITVIGTGTGTVKKTGTVI